jgi:integrase
MIQLPSSGLTGHAHWTQIKAKYREFSLMTKRSKGTVGVESNNGRLRLRLPRQVYGGRQKFLYLGLADSKDNRRLAQAKAAQIESDIILERFDQTLQKYEPFAPRQKESGEQLCDLWRKYTLFKSKTLAPSSLRDFKKVENHIQKLPAQSLERSKVITNYLLDNLSPDTARRVIMQLNACCEWAVEREIIPVNPFKGTRSHKVLNGRSINPFTVEERDLIIECFEKEPYHQAYAAFVKFLFLTGCRTSEAVGLQWQHLDPSLSLISFQEAVVEGQRGATKNRKIRKFPINQTLKNLLGSIQPPRAEPKKSVFSDSLGGLIRPNNFLRRHWQPVVKSLPIPYRPQYNTRHTFVTLCLEEQVPISQVAAWVGNSPKIILQHYAGLTRSEVPEL